MSRGRVKWGVLCVFCLLFPNAGRLIAKPAFVPVPVEVPPTLRHAYPTPPTLMLPRGYRVSLYAANLPSARFMASAPNGMVVVSLLERGSVMAFPEPGGAGRFASRPVAILEGLRGPHGLAFHNGFLYVAETHRVIRFPYRGPVRHAADSIQVVIPDLPTGGHWTRTIVFGPDRKLYLSIGSSCNVCVERHPWRAAVLQANPDGSGVRLFAGGLRNSVGLAFSPKGELWATENGRDWLGDDLPHDEVNILREGKHYGWPYCYGNRIADGEVKPGEIACRETEPPVVELQAHSAPLGLAFYEGDLLVASHGSWNRTVPTGYKIFRVRLSDGPPFRVEDFATGWLSPTGVRGRPVGLLVARDGSLLVSDDKGGVIYRIHR